MRIWIEYSDERVREFNVEDAAEAVEKFRLAQRKEGAIRWEISSYVTPPKPPEVEPEQEFLPRFM